MLIMCLVEKKIYKKWSLFAIETSFVLNLILISAATFYVRQSDSSSNKVAAYTSVGVAFSTFMVILLYHAYAYVIKPLTEKIKNKENPNDPRSKLPPRLREPLELFSSHDDGSAYVNIMSDREDSNPAQNVGVTRTVIDSLTH